MAEDHVWSSAFFVLKFQPYSGLPNVFSPDFTHFFHRATVRDYIQDLSLSMHEKKNEEKKRNWHDSLGNDGLTLAMDNPIIIQWYKKC